MPSVPVRRDIGSPSAAEVVEVERGSPHSESSLATTLPSVLVRRASCEVPGPMNVGNMDSISSLATTLPSVLVRKGSSSAVARLGAQFNGGAAKTSDEAVGLATALPSVLASRASDEAAGPRDAGNMDPISSLATALPSVFVRSASDEAPGPMDAAGSRDGAFAGVLPSLATALPSVLAKKASDEASVSQAGARVAGNDANPASGSEEIPLVRVRTWLSGSFSCGSKMVLEVAPPMEDVSAQAGLECQAAETQTEAEPKSTSLDQLRRNMAALENDLCGIRAAEVISEEAFLQIVDALETLNELAERSGD